MKYLGYITSRHIVVLRQYTTIEADSEEEAIEMLKRGEYSIEDEETLDELGESDERYTTYEVEEE